VNDDGLISDEEFRNGVGEIPDCALTTQQIEDLLTVLDKSSGGQIDYTEFSELFGDSENCLDLALKMTGRWALDPGTS